MKEKCGRPVSTPVERVQPHATSALKSEMTRRRGVSKGYAEAMGESGQLSEVGSLRPPRPNFYDERRISHAGCLSWLEELLNPYGERHSLQNLLFCNLRNRLLLKIG